MMAKAVPRIFISEEGEETTNSNETTRTPESIEQFMAVMHKEAAPIIDPNGMPSKEWIKANFKTKSAAIRYLDMKGFPSKDIAFQLEIRYQHVRNVLSTELKRGPNEVFHETMWNCPHTKAQAFIDVIVRKGIKDPSSDRILYRVCTHCARDLVPGCSDEAYAKILPGVKL